MTTGARLRQENAKALDGFLWHPFFAQVGDGTLPVAARDAYFAYEYRFVEQAVTVLAHMLTKAPMAASRKHLIFMLNGLATDQIAVFERIFAQIRRPMLGLPGPVVDFCEGMTEIARDGNYAQGLTAMLAAEWTYAKVSKRLSTFEISDVMLRDWFDLHTQPAFLKGVAWLEEELDAVFVVSDEVVFSDISDTFLRAIDLEIDFHTAALRVPG